MFKGEALGTVIINLQRTPLDSMCAVRVWAKLDDAFKLLVEELGIDESLIRSLPIWGTPLPQNKDVFTLPYNSLGAKDNTKRITLDLSIGAKVVIAVPGASNQGAKGEVVEKTNGNWTIRLNEKDRHQKDTIVRRVLGKWMIEAAIRGAIPHLPIVNTN